MPKTRQEHEVEEKLAQARQDAEEARRDSKERDKVQQGIEKFGSDIKKLQQLIEKGPKAVEEGYRLRRIHNSPTANPKLVEIAKRLASRVSEKEISRGIDRIPEVDRMALAPLILPDR
jgi:hypothetical protein